MKYVLLFCILSPMWLHAQPSQDTLFNRYYEKRIEKLRELYTVRGAEFICETGKQQTDYRYEVKRFIQSFKSNASKAGVLFYSVEKDSLRIWIFTQKAEQYVATACSKQNLIDAEYALRTAMGVEALAATRSLILKKDIQKRSTISKAAKPSSTGIEKAIQQSTALLLPTQITSKLEGLKHLFIIPEFNISQFPFHILKPYASGGYLVDSLSYSFVPHLCNFGAFAMENNTRIGNKNALKVSNPLVVGNPTYSNATEFDLPKLPGAENEATLVADMLGTYPLMGEQAGKSKVVFASQNADLLYFATHGHFDEGRMLDGSFLAFAPDSSSSSGFLTAREIQTLKLPAKLAILSACQTGFGKVFSGGFHGIGRAFYKAGVNFNVISLWSVDDDATKELMARFMVKMMQPDYFFPASQLQQAIIAIKSKYPNPAYWAAFSVFGFTY